MTGTQKYLSKLRLRFIPNVTKFKVASVRYLAEPMLFGLVKKARTFETAERRVLSRRNKYLNRQYMRLITYAKKGEITKFENLAMTLIRSSENYQIAMLHSASKSWYTLTQRKIIKLWNRIVSLRDSTDLKYERWWIDKKPGDYARPIGAPKLEWKVNMLKYLMILEIYYHTKNIYPDWQHAGTARRGLVSAWKDVLLKALPSAYIYEFDIRGFFNNITNQDAVKELPRINSRINEMSQAQPEVYNVPLDGEITIDMNTFLKLVGWSITFDLASAKGTKYEQAAYFLAEERDLREGVGFKYAGFPQGANFSPFLSCLTLGRALRGLPGLLMYMDDGVIYADTKQQLSQRIRRLKERLATIDLEIAEAKSGIIKEPGEFRGIKFLGIRINPLSEMMSETRSGTKKAARISLLKPEEYEIMRDHYNLEERYETLIKDFIANYETQGTASEKRIRHWIAEKATSKLKGLKWAAEKGFLSNIIAEIHDPSTTPDRLLQLKERLDKQLDGELLKISEIYRGKSFSSHIMRVLTIRDPSYIPDIESISTYSSQYLLKLLRTRRSRGGVRKLARR